MSTQLALNEKEPTYPTFGVPWPPLNDGLTYTDLISPTTTTTDNNNTEWSLINFYSTKHKNSAPLQGWLQRIRNGQITIDGKVVTDPDTILRVGSELVYHRLPWKEPDVPYLLQILYEDDDLMNAPGLTCLKYAVVGVMANAHDDNIALNKPSGLQVLPGGLFHQHTVLTQLQWRVKEQSSLVLQKPHPVPVHRLGRGTSGILLCAKTKPAKARLAAYFADGTSGVSNKRNSNLDGMKRKISKMYRALATGILDEDEVVINQPIGMIRYPGVAKGLYVASSSGKPALSKVNVIERDVQGKRTLVQVEIESGRPHQIRIHLSFIGHPLIGDPLYVTGGNPNCFDSELINENCATDGGYERPAKPVPGDCGYHLHAHQLILQHPTKNEVLEITAPLPPILQTQEEAS